MFAQIIQQLFVFLAILTSMGTLLHDTKLNKAYELAVPLNEFSVNVSSNLDSLNDGLSHSHVENAVTQAVAEGTPRVQARDDHKRYYLPRYMSNGSLYNGGSAYHWPSI